MSDALPDAPNIADLLNSLFGEHRHESGREFYNREVVDGIQKIAGQRLIDDSTISKMRTGQLKRPSMDAVEALCMFFPVEPSYFYPRLAALKIRQSGRTPAEQVKEAMRATSLNTTIQDHVVGIVEALTGQPIENPKKEDDEGTEGKE